MIELKHNTTLVEADSRISGREIQVVDEGIGPLWAYRDDPYSQTPRVIVRARSFEAAWEAVVDELPTIDHDEVPEAHGVASHEELEALVEAGEYPDLLEGYEYQANASGTGIVDVGHYARLTLLTKDECREYVRLYVTH